MLAVLVSGCSRPGGGPDFKSAVLAQLAFNRSATLRLLDEIEKMGRVQEALAWRVRPGRAPIGWQIMHLAASEDRIAAKVLADRPGVSDRWIDEFRSG